MSLTLDPVSRPHTIRSSAVPDAPHARRLGIFTRLASRICGVPVSTLTLIEDGAARCKSVCGLEPRACAAMWQTSAMPVLNANAVTVIEDAQDDERIGAATLGEDGAALRFYAGAPLQDRSGAVLGALCVMDSKPRQLRPDQLTLLRTLADGAVACLSLYRNGQFQTAESACSEWELMAEWLAEVHPSSARETTDAWVPHYVRHYPHLVERLMIQAGLVTDLRGYIP